MNEPTIIGLVGRAGSGKTTCATFLERHYGAKRKSFAGRLKLLAQQTLDFTDDQIWGNQQAKEAIDPRYGFSSRDFLIKLGHAAREILGPDIWCKACFLDIRASGPGLYVIEDVRYHNEALGILEHGGYLIKLECPDADTGVNPMAPSEKSVDEIPRALFDRVLTIPRSPSAVRLLEDFAAAFASLDILEVA